MVNATKNFLITLDNLEQMLFFKQRNSTAEATDDLIGNKIANKKSETLKICNRIIQKQLEINMIIPKEIPKERYISPKERKKVIDDLRLIQ